MKGLIVDFHGTVVGVKRLEEWIEAGLRASNSDAAPENLKGVLRDVWKLGRKRYPNGDWDLDASKHRQTFTEVLDEETGCPQALIDALYDVMPAQWVPLPGAAALLDAARAADIPVCLLSNIALDPRPRLDEIGLLEKFDEVVLSYEVGVVKPDPEIFRLAADKLGLAPEECLMIGDTPGIDDGGVHIGMTCVIVPVGNATSPLEPITRCLQLC